MSWDDAADREAAWFLAEPPATFTSAPPLVASAGGKFDDVQVRRPSQSARGRHLYIYRDYSRESKEERLAFGGQKQWIHPLVAHILWSFVDPQGSVEKAEAGLEAGIADVLARIRGPVQDKTHGGAFWQVGEEYGDISVMYGQDPLRFISSGEMMEVFVRYSACDSFTA